MQLPADVEGAELGHRGLPAPPVGGGQGVGHAAVRVALERGGDGLDGLTQVPD